MLFHKEKLIIDTKKGAHHITRYKLNTKVIKALLLTILALAIIVTGIFVLMDNKSTVKVHCTNADILVFQDMNDNYIAYVSSASAEQVEAIKSIPNIEIDESVDNFTCSANEVNFFEINLGSEKVFVYNDSTVTPTSDYNHLLSEKESAEMLASSSEETQFLYEELSHIFKTA